MDEEGFRSLMEEQRNRARAARADISGWSGTTKDELSELPKTEFLGYEQDTCEAKLLAILTEDGAVPSLSEGEATLVFDRTVFYGEGGGQVGDTGTMEGKHARLQVLDTKKSDGVYLHFVRLTEGEIAKDELLSLTVDTGRRAAIRRSHSACHLLQAALRQVLGTHVEQAGSYVDEHRVRFDFSHFSSMTPEEIRQVEAIVNTHILAAEECFTEICDPETAKKKGAMALFGEKYGDKVRLVHIGTDSMELCGGTHVKNTGNIGLFRILSESSVAAGVRRIEGTTGLGVLALMDEKETLLAETAKELKATSVHDLPKRAETLQNECREARRALESAEARLAAAKLDSLLSSAKTVGKFRLLSAKLDGKPEAARALCDSIKGKYPDMVAVFATIEGEKLNFVACAGADAVKNGAHAGNILKAVSAVTGGKGGGRPDSAMSGGKDLSKVEDALREAEAILSAL